MQDQEIPEGATMFSQLSKQYLRWGKLGGLEVYCIYEKTWKNSAITDLYKAKVHKI